MVFKLKINFTTPVEIEDNNLLPLYKRIVIVMTPFTQDENGAVPLEQQNSQYWSATHMGIQYSNAWSFIPSSLKINKGRFPNVNGYFIISVPSELNLMHKLTKTYKFIYVEDAGHQKLKRLGIASNTTSSTNVTINGVMTMEGNTLKSTIPPEILSAEVSDENPKDIIFKFTNGRTLEMNDDQKTAFKGVITTNNVGNYGAYSLGTVSVDNENKSVKVSGDGIGKLTKNSIISLNTIEGDVGQDEFGFKLVKSTNFPTFKNNIKNPKLFGFITPSDNKNGNIVLRLSKDEGNTFISNINYKNNAQGFATSPHSHIALSDGSNLPNNFPSFGLIAVNNLDETNNNFKNEVSSHFNEQVVKLRSNRFARSDLNYTVSYYQNSFQNSGIFETKEGEDHHAVLQQPNASNITNLLQPIVIDTVSEVKVVYDSTKTTNNWSSNTALGEGDNYYSYAAYYYVDITFKNANTNQPVLITAKYNGSEKDFAADGSINCQYSGGHEVHHGLILNYNNQEIPEEITQTTIRDNNGNVVDLRSGANGSILRIEFPAGGNNGGTKNAYNTETNNPTSYGFTDPTKSLTLTFSDKQKKNWQGDQIENEFYFLNVMDSDGNVCLPFTKNVLFPNNWGMDKFGQLPKIVSAAVNVTYSEGAWSNKKLTLTFNQDIYNTPNVPIILNKDLELELSNLVTLSQKTISGKTITYDVVDINRNDGLSVSYDKPIGIGLNNGIYNNILYNWFGFEIYSFSNFPVINNLPVIPSIKNIVFTNIVEGQTSFGATLTWELTNDRLLGLDENPVDSSKISEYTIETASTFNATTWTNVNGDPGNSNTSFIAQGLNYNEDVFIRIRAKTYDFGEYTVSGKIIRFKISGFSASMSPSFQSNQIINFSWSISQDAIYPDGYPKYRIEKAEYEFNNNQETPNSITKGTYQTIIDDLTASGNTAFTQSDYGKNVIFRLSVKSDSNSDYSEIGESNQILTFPQGPTINSVSDPNENNIIEIKWDRFDGDFIAERDGGVDLYLANATGFDQNNWFENGGEFEGIYYELQYSTNSDMSNPIKLDLKPGDGNFKHGVGGSGEEAKYDFDISSFTGTTTFYFRVRVTNNRNGPGGDSATLGGFSDWGAIFSKTITQQLTFPEISFLDASQEDQLPIRIGDATQDMDESATRGNLSTYEIYWSYKPTTGDQANNWGGQLYGAVNFAIPALAGQGLGDGGLEEIGNNGPDLAELYGGGSDIPDAVAPGVAWLKMPVFWNSEEAQPAGANFENYTSTGGFPWYDAATGTFNNLITTGDGPDETEDMTTPLELKFIMINKNQGVAAGTSDVEDHTITIAEEEAEGQGPIGVEQGEAEGEKGEEPSTWDQLGGDIDGEAAGDYSGFSVSLSADGTKVAIGAPFNNGTISKYGHVRVYERDTNAPLGWKQLGSDIDGEAAGDYSGYSVSLSSDGSIVAIGARGKDENGIRSGHVRVYQRDTNAPIGWKQLGSDIDGEAANDAFGMSAVSLSSDGNTLAIGAKYNDGVNANTNSQDNRGHVRVYQRDTNAPLGWKQLGSDIDGDVMGDESGGSVSLSNDGTIVAIGAQYNHGDGAGAVSISDSGQVRVYQYSSSNNSWTKLGDDIDGEREDDSFGTSVSLSSDGTIVAIGATGYDGFEGNNTGHVKVYKYSSGSWTQLGGDIEGENAGDSSGYSVSLSSDGTIVAIGAFGNDAGNANTDNRGHVRVYKRDTNVALGWKQLGSDIDGEGQDDSFGTSVSLSSDGSIVAIGAYQNDENGSNSGQGYVRVYEYS